MKNSIFLKNIINHLSIFAKIYIIFFMNLLFPACEVDFKRNWCQEKLERRNMDNPADPEFVAWWLCSIREKKTNESQEEYDTYLRNKAISCKESANIQILNFYLENKRKEKCKKINRFLPTIHELTM